MTLNFVLPIMVYTLANCVKVGALAETLNIKKNKFNIDDIEMTNTNVKRE